jgi:uncharacterized surface protein with fasciclin (FAS1) repeats
MRITGFAVGCACVLLMVTAWSGAPKSRSPSVVLPFPAKPDNPAVSGHPDLDMAGLGHAPADGESKALLSPEDALERLTAGVASTAALAAARPTDHPVQRTPAVGVDGDARLAALTIMADIEALPGLGEVARAVRRVGLETLIEPGRPYTLLAPTDAAFAKLGQDRLAALLAPSGHDQLRAILSHHIIAERLLFSNFAGATGTYSSLADQAITITAVDLIKVEEAAMIETDLRAANTVIHVIDQVLLPPAPPSHDAPPSATVIQPANET